MKKTIILCGLLTVMLASCKKNEPVPPPPPPTPPPVENPAPPPAPSPRTQTSTQTTTQQKTVEKNNDGTSVNISRNGLDIKNKNGESENNINISSDKKSSIQIKTP